MSQKLTILALGLLLSGCNKTPSDAVIRWQIAGAWTYNQDGALTIAPDGSWSIMESKRAGTNSFAGTWEIKDAVLYMTTTNRHNKPAVGTIEEYKIIHLDGATLIYGEVPNGDNPITRKAIR